MTRQVYRASFAIDLLIDWQDCIDSVARSSLARKDLRDRRQLVRWWMVGSIYLLILSEC